MNTAVTNSIFTIFFALIAFGNCTIPDYIHVCHHDDPQLDVCIINSIEALRPRLKEGIPELECPSIDPFEMNDLNLNSASEGTHLATNVSNAKIYGASKFKILKLTPTFGKNKKTFRFEVIIPNLRIEADYEVDSKILLLELKGKGLFHVNISDYHFTCILKGEKVQKNGGNRLEFEKLKCNAAIGKLSIQLDNLFNGNPILGKAANDVINDNSDAFLDEVRPSMGNGILYKLTETANKITLNFAYEELFP